MKNTIIAIVAIVIVVIAVLFIKNKPVTETPDLNEMETPSEVTSSPTTTVSGTNGSSSTPVSGSTEYKNDELGFSFTYPKNLGTFKLSINKVGHGQSIDGQLCDAGAAFCMSAGGVTPNTFIQSGANGLFRYPTETELAELAKGGYKTETKINSNGEDYLLIHGKKEIDTHYIGENQAVVVFKLPTPPNFNVIGFMLNSGDMKTFLKIMDSVKTY